MKMLTKKISVLLVMFLVTCLLPYPALAVTLPSMVQSVTTPATNVPVNATVKITFKSVLKTGDTLYIKDKSTSKKVASKTTADSKNKKLVSVKPNVNLAYGKTYQVVLVSNKKETILYTFTTVKAPAPTTKPAANTSVKEPINAYATKDSDGDGLSDLWEIYKYKTNPNKTDSDGDGTPDSDWNERREYTYSMRTVMKILPPYDIDTMSDDYQDVRVIKEENGYLYFEVIVYPYNEISSDYYSIKENPNWRTDDPKGPELQQYLKPGFSSNWDNAMRTELIATLKENNIDITTMSDKAVARAVAIWALDSKTNYEDYPPAEFILQIKNNQVFIPDSMKNEFENLKMTAINMAKLNPSMTDDEFIKRIYFGKEMYNMRVRETCSSTATLINTVLRAVGIPTRIILTYTCYDFGSKTEVDLSNNLQNGIIKSKIQKSYAPGCVGDHFMNEVYIGGRWVRLNGYDLGDVQLGMETKAKVCTANDFTEFKTSENWLNAEGHFKDTPYHALEMSDMYGKYMGK